MQIWPWGKRVRYLWTDAFGIIMLLSLHARTGKTAYLDEARAVVADVEKTLCDTRCPRIGLEPPDRYHYSYAHYNAVWLHALHAMWLATGEHEFHDKAIATVRATHPAFLARSRSAHAVHSTSATSSSGEPVGIWWKIRADGSGPDPGMGFGGLDAYSLYVAYRLLDPHGAELPCEIAEVQALTQAGYRRFSCDQDLGLGMLLLDAQHCPGEPWAAALTHFCTRSLAALWVDKGAQQGGYFARASYARGTLVAFANYGAIMGLHAAGALPDKVSRALQYLDVHHADDEEYEDKAITHVMMCTARFPGWFLARNLPKEPAAATASASSSGSTSSSSAAVQGGAAGGVAKPAAAAAKSSAAAVGGAGAGSWEGTQPAQRSGATAAGRGAREL